MLRVRTGRKALRAVGRSFFKLWESKEKLTSLNTLPAVRKTKGLRRASLRADRPIPDGGRRQGGGDRVKLGPRDGTPSHTANRPLIPI